METKHWYTSKTLWGAFIMVLAIALKFFGVELSTDEQAQAPDVIVEAIHAVMALIGFIMTIVGRAKAETKLK
jgi:uncharacterized membrane protein